MKVLLGISRSETNVINKVVEYKEETDLFLKRDVDLINLTIDLRVDPLYKFNYLKIVELGYFYLVKKSTSINNDITRFECELDVLETFKENILDVECIYLSNKSNNNYLNNVKSEELKIIEIHKSDVTLGNENNYILSTMGVTE